MRTYRAVLLMTTILSACSDGDETTSNAIPFYAHDAGTQDVPPAPDAGTQDPPKDAGTDAPAHCFVDGECDGCMNATKLPSKGEGDVVVVCSECDGDLCAGMAADCSAYGDACNAMGVPGICIGCCIGIDAHLRCAPL